MQIKATPKQDNTSVGERSEAIILARFTELGFRVWLPWGENHRVDMMIEDNDENIYRVQCKTGRIKSGCVFFKTLSTYAHHHKGGTKIIVAKFITLQCTCLLLRNFILFQWS